MSNYTVYTDGAYSSSRNKMGIGILFVKDSTPILEYSKMFNGGTNNKAEIIAIILALTMVKDPIDSLLIVSDSEYCIGCASLGWKRKKNCKLWEEFDKQFNRAKQLCPIIKFKHVRGHQKDNSDDTKWNNFVDRLAVKATELI